MPAPFPRPRRAGADRIVDLRRELDRLQADLFHPTFPGFLPASVIFCLIEALPQRNSIATAFVRGQTFLTVPASLGRYLDFYDRKRPHSCLDARTPD